MPNPEPIIYEQPINEHLRVCLRLEHLINQAMHWLRGMNSWDSRASLSAIVEILNVLDRPDFKAKLVKELSRYQIVLERFSHTPHIDKAKLEAIQHELNSIVHHLHNAQGRLGQMLRDNDFLNNIRQYLLNPGGGCSFEIPNYHYWLNLPPSERISHLTHWFSNLRLVNNAVSLTLRLIRQSSASHPRVAHEGFYQAPLDSQSACQLVRVALSHGATVYPEISVGRHGVSIRFFVLNVNDRPTQANEDIKFQLACCVF